MKLGTNTLEKARFKIKKAQQQNRIEKGCPHTSGGLIKQESMWITHET